MSLEIILIALLALAILLILIMAEMPIWIALGASGAIGLFMISGSKITYGTLGAIPFSSTSSFTLLVVPMFVLMGVFAGRAEIASDIFAVAERLSRKIPGGLGVATILACGGFSAVTGSSVATVTTIGKIAIEQMARRGYRANAAAALVALGATLGVLIPPSILMVIFGILTEQSIGKLLIAGIIPGIVTMIFYVIAVVVFYKRGFFEPKTEKEKALLQSFTGAIEVVTEVRTSVDPKPRVTREWVPKAPEFSRLEKKNWVGTGYALLLFLIVIGGMYSGLFTSTESGAVAAVAAMLVLIIRFVKKGPKYLFNQIKESLYETASVNTMIFALLFGGAIFAFFLIKSGIPNALAREIIAADLPPLMIIIISLIMLVILGALMDELSILLIVIPLLWPVIDGMGVDGIWYGILVMKATAIGLIAPPVGINVFVVAGLSKHTSADQVYKAILPFFLAEIVVIALLIMFPELSTFLPNLMN